MMLGLTRCHQCGYGHRHGPRYMDIYQQLDQTEGSSMIGKIVLAFVLPMMIFVVALVVVSFLLPTAWSVDAKAIVSTLIALCAAAAWVLITHIITRPPIN